MPDMVKQLPHLTARWFRVHLRGLLLKEDSLLHRAFSSKFERGE